MKEFISAVEENEDEAAGVEEGVVEFKLDGRVLHAHRPNPSQLAFLLASMGRGQRDDQRFANIINALMASLRDDDKDYFEARMLETDPKKTISLKLMQKVFEYIISEWFADPTQEQSGSAPSQPTTGDA